MNLDFNVELLIDHIGLILKNNFTQPQLNCFIESCFKISYSILSSNNFSEVSSTLSEEEKIDLSAKSISALFEIRNENSSIYLTEVIQLRAGNAANNNNKFYVLYDVIKENTMKELSLQREHSVNSG